MTHDDVQLLIGPYVLGTASEEERHIVETHAVRCAECGQAIADFEQVSLGLAWASVTNPPCQELRERVLAAVAEAASEQIAVQQPELPEGRARPVAAAGTSAGDAGPSGASSGQPRRLGPAGGARGWRRAEHYALPLLAAASVVLGLMFVDARRDLAQQSSTDRGTDGPAPMRAMYAAGNSRLSLTGMLRGADGDVVVDRDHGYVVVRDLPDPPRGRAWQAWHIPSDAPRQKESLEVLERGSTLVVVPFSPDPGGEIGTVAITLEPSGGSDEPSGRALAVGSYGAA